LLQISLRAASAPAPLAIHTILRRIPMASYDVIIIGAGPGGYVAAIRCAQLGL
jgi:ribulose 1,5-bisphosphate synthetase/thiazole synthase